MITKNNDKIEDITLYKKVGEGWGKSIKMFTHIEGIKCYCMESDRRNATLGWKKNCISILARLDVINSGGG